MTAAGLASSAPRFAATVALTVRVDENLARQIEAYRQTLGPIPPSFTAACRHLIERGLSQAHEDADAQAPAQ